MLRILEIGRDGGEVRQTVDSVFRVLEAKRLIVPWSHDANPETTYRSLSRLGRDLTTTDTYQEYLYGATRIVERWAPSVLRIINADGDGIGTGFFVGPACVATARHLIHAMPRFRIQSATGEHFEHNSVLLHPVPTIDLAVIRLKNPNSLRPFRLASTFALLDSVVVFGYPPIARTKDAYLVVNRGEVSARPTLYSDDQEVIVVSCLLRGGYSGGPVVDERGGVIGVVSQQLFKEVAPSEKSINESLGLAAATMSTHISDLL